MAQKRIIHAAVSALFIMLLTMSGTANAVAAQPVKSQLRAILAASRNLSERERTLYAHVIDHYIPECPGKQFDFSMLSDAIKVEDSKNGTFIVEIYVACDDTKNKSDKLFIGERLALDSKLTVRSRLDIYRPTGELAEKLKLAFSEKEEEKLKASPEPSDEGLRKQQIDSLLALLNRAKSVSQEERTLYREVVSRYLPLCPDYDQESFKTIQDAVWLSRFNEGYLAVSLVTCDWKDLGAYVFDKQGHLQGRFNLPAGKYGLGPVHELKVGDYTGDRGQEFYYRKVFPTSSVPAFMTRVLLYMVKPGNPVPHLILDIEVENQDCFEGTQEKPGIGSRNSAELKFFPEKGLIIIEEQDSMIDCSSFSWGEKPARPVKTTGKRTKKLQWDVSRFSYVPVGK